MPLPKTSNNVHKLDNLDPPEVLVLLSGGLDSAACLNFYLDLGRPVCGLFVNYQQPSCKYEENSAEAIAKHYNITLYKASWQGLSAKQPGLIAGRNMLLLTAALMEIPQDVTTIASGVHAGTQYGDCSPQFIELMQSIYDIYMEGSVRIAAPFLDWTKSDLFSYAISEKIPLDKTYSCEAGVASGCGACLSCLDREYLKKYA